MNKCGNNSISMKSSKCTGASLLMVLQGYKLVHMPSCLSKCQMRW